jgi:hypothetical protein
MNAREELEHYLTFSGQGPRKRQALIDAYAHELAERIRNQPDARKYGRGKWAADLIDPSAGLVRPGEETTT